MFSKTDKVMHKGLMKILDEGTFELKAREIPAFSRVYNWALTLMDEKKPDKKEVKQKKKVKKK
jgi:hypothetical protein